MYPSHVARMLVLLVAFLVGGCLGRPLIPFSLDTPPLILTPATLANVSDARGRFREIYCAIRADHGQHLPEDMPCEEAVLRLSNEPPARGLPVNLGPPTKPLRVVVVPGLFEECLREHAQTFSDGLIHLKSHGYRTDYIPVGGRSGTAHNAGQIRDFLRGLPPGERVLLVAHSKGAADSLEALAAYPDIISRVAALATVAGVIAGSPLADGYAGLYQTLLQDLDIEACPAGDGQGVESIRRTTRLAALGGKSLPPGIKYFSLAGIPGRKKLSRGLRPFYRQLARVDPRNDGQMTFFDAVIPGGTLLGFVRADHWALAVPFSRNTHKLPFLATFTEHNAFPREVLLEAIVRTVEEDL